ncbi:hypothetical protein [Ancylobacter sp. G4_0304]|uniref:hypothetical protein n=1 Tax=Ancylobacter sp. G4_0304 TaxID=3114289 RepID=UPI0039C5E07C
MLTPERREPFHEITFHQRPLKQPKIGFCTLLPPEARLPKSRPLFQRRRFLEEINALFIIEPGKARGRRRTLSHPAAAFPSVFHAGARALHHETDDPGQGIGRSAQSPGPAPGMPAARRDFAAKLLRCTKTNLHIFRLMTIDGPECFR